MTRQRYLRLVAMCGPMRATAAMLQQESFFSLPAHQSRSLEAAPLALCLWPVPSLIQLSSSALAIHQLDTSAIVYEFVCVCVDWFQCLSTEHTNGSERKPIASCQSRPGFGNKLMELCISKATTKHTYNIISQIVTWTNKHCQHEAVSYFPLGASPPTELLGATDGPIGAPSALHRHHRRHVYIIYLLVCRIR
jgi:hypothetical protein